MDHQQKEQQQHNRQQKDKEKISSNLLEGIKSFPSPDAITYTDNRPSTIVQRREDIIVDLLNNLSATDARLLITEIGRKSIFFRALSSTYYNAGLHTITSVVTGSHDDEIRKNFPFDE